MNPLIGATAIATVTLTLSIFSMLQFKSASMEKYSEMPGALLSDVREMKDESRAVETRFSAFQPLVAYRLEGASPIPQPTNAPKQSGKEPKKPLEKISEKDKQSGKESKDPVEERSERRKRLETLLYLAMPILFMVTYLYLAYKYPFRPERGRIAYRSHGIGYWAGAMAVVIIWFLISQLILKLLYFIGY